ADMQLELFVVAERRRHRDGQQAARLAVEAGPRPDAAPGVLGDELLEVLVERRRVGGGARDMRLAQHALAHGHAAFVEPAVLGVIRHRHLVAVRNWLSRPVIASGRSAIGICAAPSISVKWAPLIAPASSSAAAGGVARSSSPTMTSAGHLICAASPRRSASR